jgi:phenylacetate-CoA ligase
MTYGNVRTDPLPAMTDRIKAALEKLRPSVFPEARAQRAFATQLQLADSQWLAAEIVEQRQLQRLKIVARFATRQTRYYAEHVAAEDVADAATLREALDRLPLLSRETLRTASDALRAARLPEGHRAAGELSSSGSTGMVVRLTTTDVMSHWQNTLGVRSHIWAGRDFSRSIAVIRREKPGVAAYPDGLQRTRWGAPIYYPFPTGNGYQLNARASLEEQWEWLTRLRPSYLLTVPSIIRSFAQRAPADVRDVLPLQGLSTIGEVVDGELRTLAQERMGASIHDLYSSEEAGCIAIQCPDAANYHVQAEGIIAEVLDKAGKPCEPGEVGRVAVTPLMNFATPLIRYEMGDYAEAAAPCSCGRGLPTLKRIVGRRRNILVTPDGRHYWPTLHARHLQKVVRIKAHQFRQVAVDVIEVWLAVDDPVTAEEEEKLRAVVTDALPARFDIRFHYVKEFPRSPSGKHEEFISTVSA